MMNTITITCVGTSAFVGGRQSHVKWRSCTQDMLLDEDDRNLVSKFILKYDFFC